MRLPCLVGLILLSLPLAAQRSEVGFGLGTFNHTGDLARTYDLRNSRPAATVFYRANLSKVASIRTGVTAGNIAASDRRPIDAFAEQRDASFSLFLLEAALTAEYHFMNWRDDRRMLRFTPYLFGGLALFSISGEQNKPEAYSNVQVAIPFGLGMKYVINPKWYVSLEAGARKTFFDYLDNVSVGSNQLVKNYQYGNPHDSDVYYFVGLSITRTFYEIPCPRSPY